MNRLIVALVIVLAVATVTFASAAVHLWQEEREGRTHTAALAARVLELEQQLSSARTIAAPKPEAEGAAAPISGTAPNPPPLAPERPALARTLPAPAARNEAGFARAATAFRRPDALMKDPEYRAAMRAQQKMMLSVRYSDLSEALQLQPEEASKLLDLLAEQQAAMMNRPPLFASGATPDPAAVDEWRQRMEQQRIDNEAQIANLLGEGKMQEWKEYQGSEGARMQVAQLRQVLANSAEPLRQDQVQPLVKAVAAEQKRTMEATQRMTPASARQMTRADQLALMEKSFEQTAQTHQRLHDTAAGHLSSQQLEQFDQMLKQQADMQRISLRMMRASAEAEARGEVASENVGLVASPTFIGGTR